MADQDIQTNWDTIWKLFRIVDKGYKLHHQELYEFYYALSEVEAALRDKAIKTYVREKIKARKARRKKEKGGTRWNLME